MENQRETKRNKEKQTEEHQPWRWQVLENTIVFNKGITPSFWPTDGSGQPLRYVFRAMRNDGLDLNCINTPGKCISSYKSLLDKVFNAILTGSKETSLFLHASTDFWCARKFAQMEADVKPGGPSTIVRIDLDKLHELRMDSKLLEEGWPLCIDVSTERAVKFLMHHCGETKVHDLIPRYRDNWATIAGRMKKAKEVLILFRGEVPLKCMEVDFI